MGRGERTSKWLKDLKAGPREAEQIPWCPYSVGKSLVSLDSYLQDVSRKEMFTSQ
jgi:hypothetical protein